MGSSISVRARKESISLSWSSLLSNGNFFTGLEDGQREKIWKLMMPVYFTNDTIREEHAMILKSTWLHISQNTAPLFHKSKIILSAEDFPYENAMDWFGKIFYRRLFDIHPQSMHWFDDTEKQSKALVGFLNLGLSAYQDKKGFHDKLKFLTDIHYKRGIRAPSYGPFGEALFWTLEFCLGQEIYNEDAHRAWVILYSMILRIMVGKTVELEVKASNEREKQNADTGTEDVIKTATEAKVVPTHIRSYSYREDFNYPVYERAEVN